MKRLILLSALNSQMIGSLMNGLLKTTFTPLVILCVLFFATGNAYGDFWRDGYDAIEQKNIPLAVKIFKAAAESGDADASEQLARLYDDHNNEYGIQNKAKAAQWYKRAVELGHDSAEMRLAIMYEVADGIPEDKEFAASVYEKFVHIGKIRKNGKANYEFGLAAWRLGRLYENGEGVEKNEQRAFGLYKIAYEEGLYFGFAAYDLARAYDFGIGVQENNALAVDLYEKIGDFNSSAARRLYKMYRFGEGVPESDENGQTALKWFNRAIHLGDPEINFEYGKILLTEENDEEKKKGLNHLTLAANEGFLEAMLFLGINYSSDTWVFRDPKKGIVWLRKTAKAGDALAMAAIGILYSEGKGVEKDATIAADWALKAANLAHPLAQYQIGQYYLKGTGVEKDLSKALFWHTKAAEKHFPKSQAVLGVMYLNGKGVIIDPVQSHMWFNLAASNGEKSAAQLRDFLEKDSLTVSQKEEAIKFAREWLKLHPKN